MKQLGLRFWIEAVLATLSGALLVLSVLWKEWIEIAFRVDPDAGSGAAEWAIVALMLVLTLTFMVLARMEWRRVARQVTASTTAE